MDSGSQILHLTTFRDEEVVAPFTSLPIKLSFVFTRVDPMQLVVEDEELDELVDEIPLKRS